MAKRRRGSEAKAKAAAEEQKDLLSEAPAESEPEEKAPEEKEEPKKAPPKAPKSRKPRKPAPQDIKLTARQYVRVRKYRWEKSAGFLADMKRNHGEGICKTRPEWDQLWTAFWARTVK